MAGCGDGGREKLGHARARIRRGVCVMLRVCAWGSVMQAEGGAGGSVHLDNMNFN